MTNFHIFCPSAGLLGAQTGTFIIFSLSAGPAEPKFTTFFAVRRAPDAKNEPFLSFFSPFAGLLSPIYQFLAVRGPEHGQIL